MSFFTAMARQTALLAIRGYQKTLSFDHGIFRSMFPGGYCQFQPTCSDYAYEAIKKYGIIRGGFKGFWRVARCNPFSKGGLDLP